MNRIKCLKTDQFDCNYLNRIKLNSIEIFQQLKHYDTDKVVDDDKEYDKNDLVQYEIVNKDAPTYDYDAEQITRNDGGTLEKTLESRMQSHLPPEISFHVRSDVTNELEKGQS